MLGIEGPGWRSLQWHYSQAFMLTTGVVRVGRNHRHDLVQHFMDWDAEMDKENNLLRLKGELINP